MTIIIMWWNLSNQPDTVHLWPYTCSAAKLTVTCKTKATIMEKPVQISGRFFIFMYAVRRTCRGTETRGLDLDLDLEAPLWSGEGEHLLERMGIISAKLIRMHIYLKCSYIFTCMCCSLPRCSCHNRDHTPDRNRTGRVQDPLWPCKTYITN